MPSDYSLNDLYKGRTFFVPDYQRGYAWEPEHTGEFWEDLSVLPHNHNHYMGTVVLLGHGIDQRLEDDKGRPYEPTDIVDGQQRLTTLLLLLNELRRHLDSIGKTSKAQGIAEQYVWITRGGQRLPRLHLGDDLQQYWRDGILRDQPLEHSWVDHPSAARLRKARSFFKERVRNLIADADDEQAAQRINSLRKTLTEQLRFSVYEVDNDAQVGVIFETLNDRGKPLTELEKAKNYFLYLASGMEHHQQDVTADAITEAWSNIYRNLMRADMTDPRDENRFLRAHWLMAYDPTRRHWNGVKSLKEHFSRHNYWDSDSTDYSSGDVIHYVKTLAEVSKYFCDIRRPTTDRAFGEFSDANRRQIIQWSNKLRRLGTLASFDPLLMAVRLQYRGDGDFYAKVSKLCERFAFRVYGVRDSRADKGQGRLFRLANDVYNRKVNRNEVLNRIRKAVAKWCNRTRFKHEFEAEQDERNWYTWGNLRYFLYEYEEYLTRERNVESRLPWEEVANRELEETIEHVLPVTPREGDWQKFSEKDRNRLTHDLGNLVLTFDNSHYSNKSFEEKRGDPKLSETQTPPPSYSSSPVLQEQELAQYSEWTPASIRDRKVQLIGWALDRWHVEGDEALGTEEEVLEEDLEEIRRE